MNLSLEVHALSYMWHNRWYIHPSPALPEESPTHQPKCAPPLLLLTYSTSPWQEHRLPCLASLDVHPLRQGSGTGNPVLLPGTDKKAKEEKRTTLQLGSHRLGKRMCGTCGAVCTEQYKFVPISFYEDLFNSLLSSKRNLIFFHLILLPCLQGALSKWTTKGQ